MNHMHHLFLAALVLAVLPSSSALSEDTRTIAIFRCEMFDTSGASNPIQKAQEEKRLDRVTQLITEGYDKDARYTTISGRASIHGGFPVCTAGKRRHHQHLQWL